jgi:hypothetical protein
MKTISLSLYNRFDYTKTVLSNLDQCFDIDNYEITICCEPVNQQIIELAKQFRPNQTTVKVNNERFGCNKNIFQCWEIGFKNNDFHIHLEDDTVPGKDFLLLCNWGREVFKDHNDVFSISGYVNCNNPIEQFFPKSNLTQCVTSRKWFTPWGWATWSNRWDCIKNNLVPYLDNKHVSWDLVLHKSLKNTIEIFPLIARIQNIGAENGSFCQSAEWHKKNQYNEYWIENIKNYHESFGYIVQ